MMCMRPVRTHHQSHNFAIQSHSFLWIELDDKPKGFPLNFEYHDKMHTGTMPNKLDFNKPTTSWRLKGLCHDEQVGIII